MQRYYSKSEPLRQAANK